MDVAAASFIDALPEFEGLAVSELDVAENWMEAAEGVAIGLGADCILLIRYFRR